LSTIVAALSRGGMPRGQVFALVRGRTTIRTSGVGGSRKSSHLTTAKRPQEYAVRMMHSDYAPECVEG
jgi:hypothetical protein